jgi:hypothetical protein
MSDINANGRRLEWRISCYCCWRCLNLSFYLRDFNTVYAFNNSALSHLKESREQSSCLTTFILSANSADISFRSTSLFLAVFVASLEQQLVRAAVSLQNFLFFFFVRSNAVSKCVHVDVYPTAGQCHASKYAIVTVHVMQQHGADCLEVYNYVTCASPARPFIYKRLIRPTK